MKFKVGDRVQKKVAGGSDVLTGEVWAVHEREQFYDVRWNAPTGYSTFMSVEPECLNRAVATIAVPRALLEKLHLVLDHSEGETFEWDGKLGKCREDIGLLLESNTMNGKGSPG